MDTLFSIKKKSKKQNNNSSKLDNDLLAGIPNRLPTNTNNRNSNQKSSSYESQGGQFQGNVSSSNNTNNRTSKSNPSNMIDMSVVDRFKLSKEMMDICEEGDQVRNWDEIFINVSNMIEKLDGEGKMPEIKVKKDFRI